jgi:hypothetical protein
MSTLALEKEQQRRMAIEKLGTKHRRGIIALLVLLGLIAVAGVVIGINQARTTRVENVQFVGLEGRKLTTQTTSYQFSSVTIRDNGITATVYPKDIPRSIHFGCVYRATMQHETPWDNHLTIIELARVDPTCIGQQVTP